MRFRLFRSPAFWLGVPGLVFLLWGWWDSMGHRSWVEVGSIRDWELGQTSGNVYAFWYTEGWPNWRDFYAEHGEASVDDASELKEELAEARQMMASFRYGFILHYCLVLGYVAMWAGLVYWRSQKYGLFLPSTAR